MDLQFRTTFKWDVDLLSGYAHEFVPNTAKDPGTHRFGGLVNPTLGKRLCAWNPDALLLFGYKSFSQLRTIAWARRRRVPIIFRGDSHVLGRGKPTWATFMALRILYAQFAAITYVGAANRDYFVQLGVPTAKLIFAPHAVNNSLFDPSRVEFRDQANALRAKLRLAQTTRVILFAGKFVPSKQPIKLLEAFLSLSRPDTALVFVGDGEEKAKLLELGRRAPSGTVHFLPFANQTEMPARYMMADIFVLPSRGYYETWGLAVNEAMHMGVPALVSDRVGCQRDLVSDGKTGWVFRADDGAHLQERLSVALDADLTEMRKRVAERISEYTYATAARGLIYAIDSRISTCN